MKISEMFCQANAKLKLKNCHLRWQEEKSSYQAQMDEQRAETNRIAAALKETQDLLETARHVQPKTTTEEEMEVFKNFCQAAVDEQLDFSSNLKEDLDKAKRELEIVHLQWQHERFYATARQVKDSEYFHSQMHIMASYRAHEQEAARQNLENAQAFYQAQINEQRVEMNRIAAALTETQDLLETERQVQPKTTTDEEMSLFKTCCQRTISQQLDENTKLKAALIEAENELKNRHLLWQKEKSFFVNQNKQASDIYQRQVKIIADLGRMEREAKQELQRFQGAHKGQMDEQRAETNRILAVLKKTEDQLEAEHVNCLELASCNAHLGKTCRDLNHAQLKNLATLQTLQEETMQMSKRNRASQDQLKEQRAETNRIEAARKKTEDMFENERHLWQQEKCLLQANEEDLQSQITNMQKKKKWFKLF
ncbi:hypothetical protein VZT92_000084 [Zoarces viviparus]|uniref:Uncharacterized protein n=1 Tax=Zoarces viviparus TaxID=48416 RepID=A0AAW1G7V2_ZOAVI